MDPSKSSPPQYAPQQYAQGGQLISQAQYSQVSYPGQVPVTVQPMVYVSPTPLARPMPDYMCYSIFTLLCCCLPLGIAALVNSVTTRTANMSGQHQLAEKSSRKARNYNHAALIIGIIILVLYLVYIFVLQDRLHQ
ncbi:putative dispanin subfamily A member 2b-like [Triplophysa rosa]|uniref:Dispanin subfamily A member 2b-like n=1 Tax=Triplophysa rosa TaxID=992332 RepID=A0A9W8C4D3_TRIRA|nr:putative dispanin subfamily A member 2b-like [Triplophysa rosa]